MKKLTNYVIAALLAAVVCLSAAVVRLSSNHDAGTAAGAAISGEPAASAQEQPEASEEAGPSARESGGEAAEEIVSFRCSVRGGAVNIAAGEDFSVTDPDGHCEAYVEDGTYIVEGTATEDDPLTVTLPEGVCFQSVTLEAAGGALTAKDIETENLYVSCDKGAVVFSGSVSADAEVEHLQGKTVLNLAGQESDYNYELDYKLGHIGIGSQQYAGTGSHHSVDNGADKTLGIHCTMGSVSVLFL